MTPELLGEAIVDFAFLAVFLGILGIGALIADYIFPHKRYCNFCNRRYCSCKNPC